MIGLNYEWKQQKKASWVLADKEDIWFGKQKEKYSSYYCLYGLYCMYHMYSIIRY
jgi:hypothetical protein